jgi:Zn-dependent protease with chaperone function
MTNDQWDRLVRRLDEKAKVDPRGYKRSVALWAIGGYSVLVGALLFALAAVVGVGLAVIAGGSGLLLKLGIPALAFALMIARALSVRLTPPQGIELNAADAPGLFVAIERLRERHGAPKLDHVLLNGDLNAAIVQLPRLGALGWQRNYLIVGLPFMRALSPEEFSSVLAHELGHIGGQHGRFGAWIYRLRTSWGQLMEELDRGGHVGAGLLRRFFHWYVPRFSAHSFALARAHEYEADRASAEAVGARHAAMALARGEVSAAVEHHYWEQVYRGANEKPAPPRSAFAELVESLPAAPSEAGVRALSSALAQPTDTADTHPSLSDRLRALGCPPEQLRGKALDPPERTAADEMIEPSALARLVLQLDREWHEAVREAWADRHRQASGELERLGRLDAQSAGGRLTLDEAVERAELTEGLQGREAAVARWREVLTIDPGQAAANLAVGAYLLSKDDEAGLGHLELATASDPSAGPYAAQMAYRFEIARDGSAEAARHRSTINAHLDVLNAAAEERRGLSKRDKLEPHGLSLEALGDLREQLMKMDCVAGAYLVRKRVKHLADDAPLYVLGVVPDTKWWRLEGGRDDQKTLQRVVEEVDLPGECLAIPLVAETKWLRRRLKGMPGALVFGR